MEVGGIYLDNAATTRVDEGVVKKVSEFFTKNYGNASSQHSIGREAKEELEKARSEIAKFIGAEASEIVFTSGGTESNNLALKGLALANPEKKHIITSVIEHPCILETCKVLEKQGYKVNYVGVGKDGIVDAKDVERKIRKDTLVVSVMHVNNEIGTIQPVEEIAEICKKKGVYFHTDAVQGFTKINLDLKNIDLMSVSGHKIHAPKGVGFLYVKKGTKISAIINGGGQESGLRSGTENIPGIIGLAEVLKKKIDKKKIEKIRDRIVRGLLEIPGTKINGSRDNRIYNNIHVSFYGIEGESLMLMLDSEGICVSTGSACASTKLKESYVLKALGIEELYIHGSLRLTLDEITVEEADFVVEKIAEKVMKLREISPFKFEKGEMK
ncbi:MAG: cysteine desulfurase [Nanoarchaeota archaeon]|nr:cysteine desulfurase [Nanoarchaeota archaeon]